MRRLSDFREGFIAKAAMNVGAIRAMTVAALVLGATALAAPAAWASTPAPAWTITSISQPTNFAPGDSTGLDQYIVTATNSGGAPTDGSTPITLTDTLPSGLSCGPSFSGPCLTVNPAGPSGTDDVGNTVTCSPGPPITCTDAQNAAPLQPGQAVVMAVPVDVAADAPSTVTNSIAVAGGGAPDAAAGEPTTISATPASFAVQSFDGSVSNPDGSPDTQAGSHPDQVTTSFNFTTILNPQGQVIPAGNMKDVKVALPPGLVGDVSATPQCAPEQLTSFSNPCPTDSQVGVVMLQLPGLFGRNIFPVYNMVHPPGMPARFGFLIVFVPVYIDTAIRTGSDYGVTASLSDISQVAPVIGDSLTLWGVPADPSHNFDRCQFIFSGCSPPNQFHGQVKPFITLPTSCAGRTTTTLSADSWSDPSDVKTASFMSHDTADNPVGMTGCNRLDFGPTISVQPGVTTADSPTGLSVDLHVLQNDDPNGLVEANLKTAAVALPQGVTVSPSAADGLGACSPEQIGLSNSDEPACPDSSKLGSVEVDTPLLPNPLKGWMYLARQGDNPFGSLLALYVTTKDPVSGVLVKLAGKITADPSTGQLTTTFDNNPQLPFEDLKLNFFGGPRAVLATPGSCGTFTATSDLMPWSAPESGPDAMPFSSFTIDSGCTMNFSPSFTAGTVSNAAGSFSPLVLSLSRSDAEQQIKNLTFTMPPGVSAKLAGVPQCSDADANAGTCPEASRIGSVTIGSGAGSDPLFLKGSVYLTGPYNGGPFGDVVVVPAVAGPFNLGNVVVKGSIRIDPRTAQPTIVSDPFPQFVGSTGIPTDIRRVDVALDRPGFTFNPTNCTALNVTGTLTSTGGASAAVAQRFQAAECGRLAFKPGLKVSTSARHTRKNGDSLRIAITSGPGQANIAKVDTEVPVGLAVRDSTLNQACSAAVFAANPAGCPAGSLVGRAVALTPLLAKPLVGPAIFVSHAGVEFPDLDIVLQGEGVTITLVGKTFVKHGRLLSRFDTVPDAPVTRFELNLPAGPNSALAGNGNLCTKMVGRRRVKRTLTMPTTLVAQNGAVIRQSTKVSVTGCGKPKANRRGKARRR